MGKHAAFEKADALYEAGRSAEIPRSVLLMMMLTGRHNVTVEPGANDLIVGHIQPRTTTEEERDAYLKPFRTEIEQSRAARWAAEFPHPQIVVGDFNSPPESPIYRDAWSGWTNAFSLSGRGFGYTRMNGWIRARIDHILTDDRWKVVRAWVGPGVGSDHKPILAEVRLR